MRKSDNDNKGAPLLLVRSTRHTGARACPSPAERVKTIRNRMADGVWIPGKSSAELAELWGVHESTVWRSSAEAARQLRDSFEVEAVRARVFAMLARAERLAEQSDDPARAAQALTQAARVLAEVTGAKAPTKVALSASRDEVPFGFVDEDDNAGEGPH